MLPTSARDEHTLTLARKFDRRKRQARDPAPLLMRATVRLLPSEHPTAALAYRIRKQLAPKRPRHASPGVEQHGHAPSHQAPRIGM